MSEQVTIAAHPWVYAARREGYDVFPIIDEIMADMAYAGFEAIELMHTVLLHDGAVERVGEASREHSLPVLGSSFGGAMWDATQAEKVVEAAYVVTARLQALGGRTLGVSVGKAPAKKTPEQFDVQVKVLRELDAMCRQSGIVMNLHNHTYEVEDGEYDLRGTLERFPEVKLGPDLNWLRRAGIEPVDFIRRHGKSIVFMHLRDARKDGRWVESVGEGDEDFAAIRAALDEVSFTGQAAVELAWESDFEPTRPLRESLKLSREHIRKTMGW
jgi:sugar phosphate isomerase/epimerase